MKRDKWILTPTPRNPLHVQIDGKMRNLTIYSDGPYRFDVERQEIFNANGVAIYTLDADETGGEKLTERWNHYHTLYLMLK